jgi:hypothetical protein
MMKLFDKITPLYWYIAVCLWSVVAIFCAIFSVSFQTYGKYWWGVSVILLTGFSISMYRELFRK